MYVTKCTYTVIIFALILNVNAQQKKNDSVTTGKGDVTTTTQKPIISTPVVSDPTPNAITVPVTETTLLDNDTTTVTSSTTVTTPTTPTTPTTIVTPVTTPNITTTSPNTTEAPPHSRQFDGPSFIGGIVLATGLMAIGFVAFKFYKARTERNYHTL